MYLFPQLAGIPAWEVDQPDNIAPRQTRVANCGSIVRHLIAKDKPDRSNIEVDLSGLPTYVSL